MADIFVSYASEDRERVRPLVQALETEGWSVWWDREMVAGPRFEQSIQEALDDARCVIVAWSQTSVTSAWCCDEAREGLERQCLVPLRIDDVRPPLGFRSSHTASLLNWPTDRGEIDIVVAGVRTYLTTPDAPDAALPSMDRSIAVLPFSNLSSDPEQAYFCDGLAEDLIDLLVRVTDLRVIARTSSFRFKGAAVDVRDVARQLGVSHIVEGSVRRAGDQVLVVAQLIRARDGAHEWSERYNRNMEDIFMLQEEVAREIATALDVRLAQRETRQRQPDPEAHLLLLQANHLLDASGGGSRESVKAIELLKGAVEIDPEHAKAWAALSRAYGQASILLAQQDPVSPLPGLETFTVAQCLRLAAEAENRTLILDPDNTSAISRRAWVPFLAGDKGEAAHILKAAIARRGADFDLAHSLVRLLVWSNRSDDAVVVAQWILQRDPLNVVNIANLAQAQFVAGHLRDAEVQIQRALALNPLNRYALWLSGMLHLLADDPRSALTLAEEFADDSIDHHAMRVMSMHSLGRLGEAGETVAELARRWPHKHYETAGLYAWMNRPDLAFEHLARAVERALLDDVFGSVNTLVDPRWRPFHDDSRWLEFLGLTHQTDEDLAQFDVTIDFLA